MLFTIGKEKYFSFVILLCLFSFSSFCLFICSFLRFFSGCNLDRFPIEHFAQTEAVYEWKKHALQTKKKGFFVCWFQMKPFHGSFSIHFSNDHDYLPFIRRFVRPAVHLMPLSNQFTDFFNIDQYLCVNVFITFFFVLFLRYLYSIGYYGNMSCTHPLKIYSKYYSVYVYE